MLGTHFRSDEHSEKAKSLDWRISKIPDEYLKAWKHKPLSELHLMEEKLTRSIMASHEEESRKHIFELLGHINTLITWRVEHGEVDNFDVFTVRG